jgi:hypothetical protein
MEIGKTALTTLEMVEHGAEFRPVFRGRGILDGKIFVRIFD